MSSSSFHGVSFNPYESRLIATANANDGVVLFDLRYPEKPVIKYASPERRKGAMFAKFNQLGTQILCLMRRTGPALFNIHEQDPVAEFCHTDYSNVCTMKSPCFVGDADQYVAAGSDDFNIYVWETPGQDLEDLVVNDPFMILEGHRSIVNQIRYNHHAQILASSGVEKVIKLWSQFKLQGCSGGITKQEKVSKRQYFSHEQYMQFVVDGGEPLNHDYETRSTEEDSRMMAFFDSLIHRVNAGWFSDGSSDEESPVDDILLRLLNERNEEDSDDQSNVTVMDLRRLFRSNRRMLMGQLDETGDEADDDVATIPGSESEAESLGPIRFRRPRSVSGPSDGELNHAADWPITGIVTSGFNHSETELESEEVGFDRTESSDRTTTSSDRTTTSSDRTTTNSDRTEISSAINNLQTNESDSFGLHPVNTDPRQLRSLFDRVQNFLTSPCPPRHTEVSNPALLSFDVDDRCESESPSATAPPGPDLLRREDNFTDKCNGKGDDDFKNKSNGHEDKRCVDCCSSGKSTSCKCSKQNTATVVPALDNIADGNYISSPGTSKMNHSTEEHAYAGSCSSTRSTSCSRVSHHELRTAAETSTTINAAELSDCNVDIAGEAPSQQSAAEDSSDSAAEYQQPFKRRKQRHERKYRKSNKR